MSNRMGGNLMNHLGWEILSKGSDIPLAISNIVFHREVGNKIRELTSNQVLESSTCRKPHIYPKSGSFVIAYNPPDASIYQRPSVNNTPPQIRGITSSLNYWNNVVPKESFA
ncbi:hypothetical protein SESBI_29460 [Sesbania bispinosa]|nr:hypothetical protein SESBI_29460 [Sesbania bispinosa]